MIAFKLTTFATLAYVAVSIWSNLAIGWLQASPVPAPAPVVETVSTIDIDRITHYQAVPWQTDDTPNVSSCGPNIENQIAVSRDLMGSAVECGTKVTVVSEDAGYLGTYTVWDVTNARFNKTVDILTDTPAWWGKTQGYIVLNGEQK